ncbi:MAG: hypothetical protein H6742_08800 [Alphaproteobacteria bacterium]|nr:hypothetical protein [Alphaproteobacteria bacterium]
MSASLILAALVAAPSAQAGSRWLQNDGFDDGDLAGFQGGFVQYECWGSIYQPTSTEYPFTVEKVRLLVGGTSSKEIFSVHFYQSDTATFSGATYLGGEGVAIVGSDSAFSDINVAELELGTISVDSGFLGISVCLEAHSGYPAIARDNDGMSNATRNWIYADAGTGWKWWQSNIFGLTGDWIMRACIQGAGVGPDEDCTGDGGGGDGGTGDGGTGDGGTGDDGGADSGATGDDGGADAGGTDSGPDDGTQGIELIQITPGSMNAGEAVDLVFIGTGFGPEAEARIGGISVVGLNVVNTETITGRSPTSLPAGIHDVEVVDDDGSAVLPGAFEVLAEEAPVEEKGGCNCATGRAPGQLALGAFIGLLGIVGLRRRR